VTQTCPPARQIVADYRPGSRLSSRRIGGSVSVVVAGTALGAVSAYFFQHHSLRLALAVALVPLLVWLLSRPSRGLALGLVLMLTLPYWWNFGGRYLGQIAAVLAACAALPRRRNRRTLTDIALMAFLAVVVLDWLLQYDQPATWHIVLGVLTPVGFYLGARAIPTRRIRHFMALILFAGTVGALTVIYEFVHGSSVFVDPTKYLWGGSHSVLFRPGGIFGSAPGAATVLVIVIFFGLASLQTLHGKMRPLARICVGVCVAACIVTFTRAPLIGAGAGLILYLWLVRSPFLQPMWITTFIVSVILAALVVLPSLDQNATFQQGIVRGGSLQARESYWSLALPIALANPHNFMFGLGTGILETPAHAPDAPLPLSIASAPQVFGNSLHSQYITILVEQGIIGLISFGLLLVSGFGAALREAYATRDSAYAAVTASLLSMAVVFYVDTAVIHAPSMTMFMVAMGFAAGAPRSGSGARLPRNLRALGR
jgi:O-antigen ligase